MEPKPADPCARYRDQLFASLDYDLSCGELDALEDDLEACALFTLMLLGTRNADRRN